MMNSAPLMWQGSGLNLKRIRIGKEFAGKPSIIHHPSTHNLFEEQIDPPDHYYVWLIHTGCPKKNVPHLFRS